MTDGQTDAVCRARLSPAEAAERPDPTGRGPAEQVVAPDRRARVRWGMTLKGRVWAAAGDRWRSTNYRCTLVRDVSQLKPGDV
jgi:hypothetical protein